MRLTRRALMIAAAGAALARPLPAGAAGAATMQGPAFGASWHAVIPAGGDLGAMRAALQAIVVSVDAAMSPFRADSDISRFNASDSTGWCAIPAPCGEVVAEALRVARMTGGAFDPTVGGVVGRYGFGPIRRRSEGDHTGISIRPSAVRKARADLTLDLCGIAKGHTLDRMVEAVTALGGEDFLIEIGGEVAARGRHPSGRPWQAAIEAPGPGAPAFQKVLALAGEALATSGDRVNGYEAGGRRHGHIIDPHSRRPMATSLASVSVLAPTAMRADAMATALFAMGDIAGPEFAARHRLPALFLARAPSGIREVATGAFLDRVVA